MRKSSACETIPDRRLILSRWILAAVLIGLGSVKVVWPSELAWEQGPVAHALVAVGEVVVGVGLLGCSYRWFARATCLGAVMAVTIGLAWSGADSCGCVGEVVALGRGGRVLLASLLGLGAIAVLWHADAEAITSHDSP